MPRGQKSAAGGSAKPPLRGRAPSMGPQPKPRKAESAHGAAEPTRPVGRPPEGPAGKTRSVMLMTRWTPLERAELGERASALGVSVAEYLRRAALR